MLDVSRHTAATDMGSAVRHGSIMALVVNNEPLTPNFRERQDSHTVNWRNFMICDSLRTSRRVRGCLGLQS